MRRGFRRYLGSLPRCRNRVRVASRLSNGSPIRFWQAGAGVDWKWPVDAGSAWVFGVEYLHYGFGDQTITLTDNTGRSLSFAGKENVDTVKGRISYLFSIH